LGQRTPYGPDDLRKTDRTGRKGTVGGGFANARKASIQHSLGRHGPKGVLPEQAVAEELSMQHQRDHSTQKWSDTSNSLAKRTVRQAEVPNVTKSADGHPTVRGRADSTRKTYATRVDPTITPTSVNRLGGDRPIPSFLQKGVAENTELSAMLKYAGVPVKESVLTDSTGHTLDHILQRFSREVADFEAGGDLDQDLYEALYDYYFDDMPYGVKKARSGDPYEWIADRLADELGVMESNSGMIMPEADPMATVEAMPDMSAPVAEGSCNATMEGEYCPEHGLAECGYMESMGGTVAGGIAPVIGEAPQDPINYNGAITGSYYESRDGDALLARIKSLALLR
jgi:hypothetical protein